MTCEQYLDLAAAHVDGELTAQELATVEAHVATCARCAAVRAAQIAVRTRLRQGDIQSRASADLKARITAALDAQAEELQPHTRWTRRALLVGAMAAGLALVLLPRRLRQSSDILATLALDVRAANAEEVPLSFRTTDLDELQRYYRGVAHVPFDATVADLSKAGFQVEGGTVGEIGGQTATYTVYRRGADRILCRRFAAGSLPLPHDGEPFGAGQLYTVDGVTTWIHVDRDATCCLATTMPKAEFIAALEACGGHS